MSGRWFRLHDQVLDNLKVQSLSGELFKAWINVLALASGNDGIVPHVAVVAFRLRLKPEKAERLLAELRARDLLDEADGTLSPHDWRHWQYEAGADPAAAERMRRYRERKRNAPSPGVTHSVTRDVTVTAPDSETEQNRSQRTRYERNGRNAPAYEHGIESGLMRGESLKLPTETVADLDEVVGLSDLAALHMGVDETASLVVGLYREMHVAKQVAPLRDLVDRAQAFLAGPAPRLLREAMRPASRRDVGVALVSMFAGFPMGARAEARFATLATIDVIDQQPSAGAIALAARRLRQTWTPAYGRNVPSIAELLQLIAEETERLDKALADVDRLPAIIADASARADLLEAERRAYLTEQRQLVVKALAEGRDPSDYYGVPRKLAAELRELEH